MDREAEEGVLGVEEEIYKRTGVASTEIRQKKMRMEVDVSDYMIGKVSSMKCEDGK